MTTAKARREEIYHLAVTTGLASVEELSRHFRVTASTIRKIACDADIIPVLLGGEGRVLDIGRASRIFPPHIRKALTARDRGCAFPGCTIPAPWCEAHHIVEWSLGGPASALADGVDHSTARRGCVEHRAWRRP